MDSTCLNDLGELYHDYSFFGVNNHQISGCFALNQEAKGPLITSYVQLALAKAVSGRKSANREGGVSFSEWFCADGYYAMISRRLGAERAYAIDNGRDPHFEIAPEIAKRLGISEVEFIEADLTTNPSLPRATVVANIGGLYHVPNPAEVLKNSYDNAEEYLVVQTVYSLAENDADYFETPAPGWDWGCRFSLSWIENQVNNLGGRVIDSDANLLEGNDLPKDRGSVYFLIEK